MSSFERDDAIRRFAEAEVAREQEQCREVLRAMSDEERLRVIGNLAVKMVQISYELARLETELNGAEDTWDRMAEVYEEEGKNIDDVKVTFLFEKDKDEQDE